MKEWKEECREAEEMGEEKPRVSNYIGECFLKIANGLSFRPNFINYTYKQEMISDGIENCLQYLHNFNPDKSNNPFAYFTQIIYYAFIRRIQKEKKQLYIKYKTIQETNLLSDHIATAEKDSQTYDIRTLNEEQQANMYDFINKFEISQKKKYTKKPAKPKTANTLDAFV
jgi:hypothetical protein